VSEQQFSLFAISPLDGRYRRKVESLSRYFSEFALIRSRCSVECAYLLALDGTGVFAPLASPERERIAALASGFSEADALGVKEIERTTNHDVKALEYFLQERLKLKTPSMIHFGLTSEDTNSPAWSLLLRGYRDEVQLPQLRRLVAALAERAETWADVPFPAHTHGQPASPTTAGKELAVYLDRIVPLLRKIAALNFPAKFGGATGTWASFMTAAPGIDWVDFSRGFVTGLGLEFSELSTQVESGDAWAEYFNLTRELNGILLDLDQDFWLYLMLGLYREPPKEGEVGSSTMPHKINPIRFENAEGNATVANALLSMLSEKLVRSRMQRDLSGSTVQRNMGVALGHSFLAVEETMAGLSRVELNAARCAAVLAEHGELLSEPAQTILRAAGIPDAYERLKALSRGRPFSKADLPALADSLELPPEARARLLALDVASYTGAAGRVCLDAVGRAKTWMEENP
jgi:adenylosuccinate lyase